MEFFEQAHVAKGADSSKKDNKSEEVVKKQLKQMLHGYKNSDNELIKSSMDIKIDDDDLSSVSGFSDLNLSDSSGEDDTTRATIGSSDEVDSIINEANVDSASRNSPSNNNDDEAGFSICDELLIDAVALTALKSEGEDVSCDSSSFKTLLDSESSQEFDPDGVLASKIHENLRISNKITKYGPKRKLEKSTENIVSQKVKPFSKIKKDSEVSTTAEDAGGKSLSSSTSKSAVLSPPYISINAADIPQQKFDDILGEYKHSTVKNIPFNNNNLILPETDTSFYTAKVMTITEVNVDTDIAGTNQEQIMDTSNVLINEQNKTETVKVLDPNHVKPSSSSAIDNNDAMATELKKNDLEDSVKMHFIGNVCVCVMKHPAKLFVHGKFVVRALCGTIEIFGHKLTDQPQEVYAPYYNFAQCLQTIERDNTYYGLFGKLTTLGLSVSDAEDVVTTLGVHDAVLVLEPLRSVKINFVEEYFSVAKLFSKSSKHIDYCHTTAWEKLDCSVYLSQPHKIFEVPNCWKLLNDYCFIEHSRGIVCGGKSVGKSTCLRYHVNKLVAHGPVLVVDLDIGQSEFTVAGNISATIVTEPLLGPNFTHLRKPERTVNLGMINALDNMRRYVNAVVELLTHCARDARLRTMRWMVNTMGLCNVVGLHFITIIILHCRPTYLLQIDAKNPKKRYDMFLRPQLVAAHYDYYKNMRLFSSTTCPNDLNYSFTLSHHTDNPARNQSSVAPRDERYLNFLAYFGELLDIYRGSTLLGITPYEVQIQDLCVYMNVKIPEGTVLQVLNGKIVALCQQELGSVTKKTYVLADKPLLCHGHGLIRGIDFERGILYVITPMPAEGLHRVNALLYADWAHELRGLEANLPAGVAVPYRMPTMHQQKQLMFTPRRRFNPVQLLKISRDS